MGTGVAIQVWSPESLRIADCGLRVSNTPASASHNQISIGSDKSCSLHESIWTATWGHAHAGLEGVQDQTIKKRINAAKRLAISTGQLNALLRLHTRPIDPVVFREPTFTRNRRPHLAEGFMLICLQHLS